MKEYVIVTDWWCCWELNQKDTAPDGALDRGGSTTWELQRLILLSFYGSVHYRPIPSFQIPFWLMINTFWQPVFCSLRRKKNPTGEMSHSFVLSSSQAGSHQSSQWVRRALNYSVHWMVSSCLEGKYNRRNLDKRTKIHRCWQTALGTEEINWIIGWLLCCCF